MLISELAVNAGVHFCMSRKGEAIVNKCHRFKLFLSGLSESKNHFHTALSVLVENLFFSIHDDDIVIKNLTANSKKTFLQNLTGILLGFLSEQIFIPWMRDKALWDFKTIPRSPWSS